MKAKDLVNVEPGKLIEVPWEAYSVMNGKFVSIEPLAMNSYNMRITIFVAGLEKECTTIIGRNAEIRVFGGEPVPAIDGEAIQFIDDPDTRNDVMDFVDAQLGDFEYTNAENYYGLQSSSKLEFDTEIFSGVVYEGQWLVKRSGKAVVMTDDQFQILFGGE